MQRILPRKWSEFISKQPVLRIATFGDRYPHVTPVWFVLDENTFYVVVDDYTKKLKNIRKNNHISALVDYYDPSNWQKVKGYKGIMLRAKADIVDDPQSKEHKKARKMLQEKYIAYAKKYRRWMEGKDPKGKPIIIKFTSSSFSSWEY